MFLAKGSFWQAGLVSEEGAWMDNAEASNLAAPPPFLHRGDGDGEFLSPSSPTGLWVPFP